MSQRGYSPTSPARRGIETKDPASQESRTATMRTRAARIRPALWISVLTLLVGATGLLSATGSQAALVHQSELPASPGYWVLTSSGTVYNYGVPNFAGPVTTGRSICPNDVSTPSGDCIGISAPPGGLGYWVGAGPTAPP